MNVKIGKYQFFTGAPFWVGIGNFKGGLGFILDWQMGIGFIRINKYSKRRKNE